MNWEQLITTKRFGMENIHVGSQDSRTEFQRDYDRLIFSPPFRRLQNKTQVFPLPGSVFVHNRLTHSLEVSCIGRSIANIVSMELAKRHPEQAHLFTEIGTIVATACLAHDMGNPPFGHSGENAIGTFFSERKGQEYRERITVSDEQWRDFEMFEGNANTFRLLTHTFEGRRAGGFVFTYPTLASIVKYPYQSIYADSGKQKFGFFVSDRPSYERIANDLGIVRDPQYPERYVRYPLVYIVEAADDICYELMDIEDAFKLKIISYDDTVSLLLGYLDETRQRRAQTVFSKVEDRNERIAYLRSTVMSLLVDATSQVFLDHEDEILAGTFSGSLLDCITGNLRQQYDVCAEFSAKNIYRSHMVVDIELAGYKIISELLELIMAAAFEPQKSYSRLFLDRIPHQYAVMADDDYLRVQSVLDYISGMTDVYALDLYSKINGTSLPRI